MNAEAQEAARQKAKALRYKRPIAKDLNLDKIREELWEMQEAVGDVQWMDDDTLTELLGDEDQAYEFKMAFSDLCAELERMQSDMEEAWIPECFDTFFPAIRAGGDLFGYDSFEGDYFGLDPLYYDHATEEAQKKLTALTKKDLIEAAGACMRIALQYVALRYRYDCLSASLDILRGEQDGLLQLVRTIEDGYKKAEAETFGFKYETSEAYWQYCKMLDAVPDRMWIE